MLYSLSSRMRMLVLHITRMSESKPGSEDTSASVGYRTLRKLWNRFGRWSARKCKISWKSCYILKHPVHFGRQGSSWANPPGGRMKNLFVWYQKLYTILTLVLYYSWYLAPLRHLQGQVRLFEIICCHICSLTVEETGGSSMTRLNVPPCRNPWSWPNFQLSWYRYLMRTFQLRLDSNNTLNAIL